MSCTLLVIAGEVSGDMHAAALVRALRQRVPKLKVFGIGGDRLAAEGMEIVHHVREMAVMGLGEVVRRYRFFRRVFFEMVEAALLHQPDAVILVDYPGFNLRFAQALRPYRLKCIYFVCPQVWAWRRGRIRTLAANVSRLLCIFPFEPAFFERSGLRVDYVGHPLVDEAIRTQSEPPPTLPWQGEPHIALLPGSRRQEVQQLLPALWGAANLLQQKFPTASFLIATPSDEIASYVSSWMGEQSVKSNRVGVTVGVTRHVLSQAAAAVVASGTATIEAALMNCPHVVVYRMSPLTYVAARLLVRVPHIGMVNLVAGRRVCPELIQRRANPRSIALELERLLVDGPDRTAVLEGLRAVRERLGPPGAAERAASIVLEELGGIGECDEP